MNYTKNVLKYVSKFYPFLNDTLKLTRLKCERVYRKARETKKEKLQSFYKSLV